MQYMLMFREGEAEFDMRDDPARAPAYWGAWTAYIGALNQAGIVVSGAGLQPPRSSTVSRSATAGARSRTGLTPIPRSSWAGISSSKCPISTSHSTGLPAVRRPPMDRSR